MLRVRNLSKYYGSTPALRGLSFEIREGEIVSFLGPNGAGKSTLFHILVGLLRNYEGEIYLHGRRIKPFYDREYRSLIGFVPQGTFLERELTVEENLKISSILYGVNSWTRGIDEILKSLDLYSIKDRRIDHLSGGMRRKVVIAKSLIHEPRYLFLDEPTTGIDVNVRRDIWNFLVRVSREKGVTVIVSTHYMEEAEALSDRVFIMDRGRILIEGSPQALKSSIGNFVVEEYDANGIRRTYFGDKDEAILYLEKSKGSFKTARIREVNLEDVFIKVIEKNEGCGSCLL